MARETTIQQSEEEIARLKHITEQQEAKLKAQAVERPLKSNGATDEVSKLYVRYISWCVCVLITNSVYRKSSIVHAVTNALGLFSSPSAGIVSRILVSKAILQLTTFPSLLQAMRR
jgi:hypothetical protein